MTMANDAAFPVKDAREYNDIGLTKRELFAMAAMQGMLSDSESSGLPYQYAKFAVEHADALIAELNKETP